MCDPCVFLCACRSRVFLQPKVSRLQLVRHCYSGGGHDARPGAANHRVHQPAQDAENPLCSCLEQGTALCALVRAHALCPLSKLCNMQTPPWRLCPCVWPTLLMLCLNMFGACAAALMYTTVPQHVAQLFDSWYWACSARPDAPSIRCTACDLRAAHTT